MDADRLQAREDGAWVAAEVTLGAGVSLAPGAVVHAGVRIGEATVVGSGAVIHARTEIGREAVIEDGAVLGKRPRLRPGSSAARPQTGPLVLADGVTVCAGAVLYACARIGERAIIGDQAQVRERARIGAGTVVGRGSSVDFDAVVGARVLIQTGVYVTAGSIVEDDVFLGPGATTTNDDTMGRHPRGEGLAGPVLRRACRIGGGAVLVPGVEVGEEAFVAAGAVVTRDVPARAVVMGVPARVVRQVSDADLLERWR
ncbi:MAG TPA: DapH/DapD/GlmU-related protein [Solirubrobacteraceae bacterium]|nr:DapH/DapD/GlmU-related protein [Solirubrobacteraceae bacterium]